MIALDPHREAEPFGDTAVLAIGIPCALLLAACAIALEPFASLAHPEILAALALAIVVASALAWNVVWILLAFIASSRLAPASAARFLTRLVVAFGTGRARRIIARTGAGVALAASIGACSVMSAAAAIAADATATGGSSSSFLWSPAVADANAETNGEATMLWRPGDGRSTNPSGKQQAPSVPRSTEAARAPARVPSSAATSPSPIEATIHIVESGENLWSIAADSIDPDADQTRVARQWLRVQDANLAVIGPDPDLIRPGLTLTIPQEES